MKKLILIITLAMSFNSSLGFAGGDGELSGSELLDFRDRLEESMRPLDLDLKLLHTNIYSCYTPCIAGVSQEVDVIGADHTRSKRDYVELHSRACERGRPADSHDMKRLFNQLEDLTTEPQSCDAPMS